MNRPENVLFFFWIHFCAPRGAVPHVALLLMFTCESVYVCMCRRTSFSLPRTRRQMSLSPTLACTSPEPSHQKHVSYTCHLTLHCQAPQFLCGTAHLRRRRVGLFCPRSTQSKGTRKARLSITGQSGTLISSPYQSFIMQSNADCLLPTYQLRPPLHTPLREDYTKEVIRYGRPRLNFHER